MEQVSVSEIQRNLHRLNDFDIIEVIDKKRDKVKGYFIEGKYSSLVEEMSLKVSEQKKRNRRSLKGIFSKYADPEKRDLEQDAWKNHVIEKYSTS